MKTLIVVLAMIIALHVAVYIDAFGASLYRFDKINKDKYVLYSFGYHESIGNYMGYTTKEGHVAWIVLVKQISNRTLSTESSIMYRMATAYEKTFMTLKKGD